MTLINLHKALRFALIGIFLLVWCVTAFAQTTKKKAFNQQLRVNSVNDSYLGLRQDRYYTNGLQISYSRWLKQGSLLSNIIPEKESKKLVRLEIAHQIYTPRFIQNTTPSGIDRPYAGYLYIQAALDSFWRQHNNLQVAINVGVIGPASGAEQIHKKWHQWFGLDEPRGWQYQIRNEPVINLNTKYRHSWRFSEYTDIIGNVRLRMGTAFNDASVGFALRAGQINPIDYSAITYSQLGSVSNGSGNYWDKEWFLFLGLEDKLVIHNTLIEGGLISPSKKSLTRKAEPNVFSVKWGAAFSLRRFTWRLNMTRLSPEVVGAQKHILVSFDMAFRF